MSLRTVFLGTPEAAVPTLEALLDSDHRVVTVVTAPDRPRGRGMELAASPVKQRALAAGIPVLQPPTLRAPEVQAELASSAPSWTAWRQGPSRRAPRTARRRVTPGR